MYISSINFNIYYNVLTQQTCINEKINRFTLQTQNGGLAYKQTNKQTKEHSYSKLYAAVVVWFARTYTFGLACTDISQLGAYYSA